jgi:hypothetical protein
MVAVFGRRRRKPAGVSHHRQRLSLERLEPRDCPAFVGPGTPLPPAILSFSTHVLPGHMVVLSGVVTDSNPPGVGVTFSGAASGSAGCDATGYFSYTAPDANLGKVTAVAVDEIGLSSAPAKTVISVASPTVALAMTYGSQRTVTLSGQVSDIDAGSLSLNFTGVVTGSVSVNSNGTFTLTTTATGLGTIQASTTDLWGQLSTSNQVIVSSPPPVITSFTATLGLGNLWTFTGTVNDPSPAGLYVQLGGVPGLSGAATVLADGTFSVTVQLAQGVSGYATAQTTDWWGQQSNQATLWV